MKKAVTSLSLATALLVSTQAVAIAAPSEPTPVPAGLTQEEQAQFAETSKALRALLDKPIDTPSAWATFGLNVVIPGAGNLYAWRSAESTLWYMAWVGALDAAAMGTAWWMYNSDQQGKAGAPGFRESSNFIWGLVAVGANHLFHGLLSGGAVDGYREKLEREKEEAAKPLQKKIAEIEAAPARRESDVRIALDTVEHRVAEGYLQEAMRELDQVPPAISNDPRIIEARADVQRRIDSEAEQERQAREAEEAAKAANMKKLAAFKQGLDNSAALAAQGRYIDAFVVLDGLGGFPPEYRTQAFQAYQRLREQIQDTIVRDLGASIATGDGAGYSRKVGDYRKRLAKTPLKVEGYMSGMQTESLNVLHYGEAKVGQGLAFSVNVETVLSNGFVFNNRGNRVFVSAPANLGLVDGQTLTFGAVYTGTATLTTVGGGRLTVRAVRYTMKL